MKTWTTETQTYNPSPINKNNAIFRKCHYHEPKSPSGEQCRRKFKHKP